MMLETVLFLLFLYRDVFAEEQYYKVSMVASPLNSEVPALYSHAESPVWDPTTQTLYFVDVHQQNVHRLDYVTGKISTKHVGYGQVNVVCPIKGSRRLLVATRSALYLLDWDIKGDSALRLLVTVDQGLPDNVINEGKADYVGRFWFGTKGPQTGNDVMPDKATLYSIGEDFTNPRTQLRPVSISNGIAWSLNNSVMYYIDSLTKRIEAFDYDLLSGEISGRRTILDIATLHYDNEVIPDGMTIDNQGFLWVALMFGGLVLHINPDSRQIIYGYNLPVSRTTSVAWGGPNMDELFVTTGRNLNEENASEPLAGAIFTIRSTGSKGIPSYKYVFPNADKF